MSTQNLTDDRRGRLNYFTTDRTHLPFTELLEAVKPFGITLEPALQRLTAWLDDDGDTWVDIGYVYRWKDGRTVARYRRGANEAMQRRLIEAASRAAVEKTFVRGSWTRLRATKSRQAGEYTALVVRCDPDAEGASKLGRALAFASNHSVSEVNCRAEEADAARMDRNEVQA